METNVSKAQAEVWEWKEKAYEKVKHLSVTDAIASILKNTKELSDNLKRKALTRK